MINTSYLLGFPSHQHDSVPYFHRMRTEIPTKWSKNNYNDHLPHVIRISYMYNSFRTNSESNLVSILNADRTSFHGFKHASNPIIWRPDSVINPVEAIPIWKDGAVDVLFSWANRLNRLSPEDVVGVDAVGVFVCDGCANVAVDEKYSLNSLK